MKRHPYWKRYYACEDGSVSTCYTEKLKPIEHHTGYHVYTMRDGKRQSQMRAHRLVYECHFGLIPKGMVINHLDGNKHNNRLNNLELTTTKGNTMHAFKTGLREGKTGARNSMSKLTEEQFLEVVDMLAKGLSNKVIGTKYNLHPNYVSLIRSKKRWRKSWELLDK